MFLFEKNTDILSQLFNSKIKKGSFLMMNKYAVVLAAGKGTRMKSKLHKVLHPVLGKSMVSHVVSTLESMKMNQIVTVVGYEAESVKNELKDRVAYALQEEQLGTGHAVQMTAPLLQSLDGTTLVTYGDVPLLTQETIENLFRLHEENHASITLLTTHVPNPTGYGRIVRDSEGNILRIVEQKDASPEELMIQEVNTGVCCYDNRLLFDYLKHLKNNNSQGEYYLTDLIEIAIRMGHKVIAYQNADYQETMGVNDRVQLSEVERILQHRINEFHMRNGVTLIQPETILIGSDVELASDVVLYPGTLLMGETKVGSESMIGPYTQLTNAIIGERTRIQHSVVTDSIIGNDTTVGPFAHIREASTIKNAVRIGNFVEVKKSVFHDGAKSAHLSYIGDAELGERVNMGCGSITVNYDGKNKHKTVIGSDTMVGCNVNLVAPIEIGANAYLAAGSTITSSVPDEAFGIARSKQVTKEHYVPKLKK